MEGRPVEAVEAVRHKGCSLREWWMAIEILPESRDAATAGILEARAGTALSMPRRAEIETMLAGR